MHASKTHGWTMLLYVILGSNVALTVTGLRNMRARMKKFGVNPLELLWICGPAAYAQFQSLEQVSTIEKFGPMATVLKGALASYQGIPLYVSEYAREDLNATGVYDGVTVNRAGIVLVNKSRWYVATRRPIKVKMQADLPSRLRVALRLKKASRDLYNWLYRGADACSDLLKKHLNLLLAANDTVFHQRKSDGLYQRSLFPIGISL